MATNLDLQQQLNQLLAEQNKLLEVSAKLAKDQVALTTQLVAAMQKMDYKEVVRDIEEVNKAISDSTEKSKTLGATNQDVFEQMNNSLKEAVEKEKETGDGLDKITKKAKRFVVALSALDGLVQGLRFTSNMLHTVGGAVTGLVGSLGHLAASIIAIPFKMLSGLIHMSDQGGTNTELLQALENVRKEFGTLKETSGGAIVYMARSMRGELAQTGLRVTRIFGPLAERLRYIQEYAHNLGPLFATLAIQFMRNAEAIGAYYKGLGLTEEGQKAVAARSFALGQQVTDNLREMTNYSHQLSKAFNGTAGSAKEISRDMGTLMADFRHFGGIAIKEIGQAVVYFRRLGVEVSKVMGVIEKYDNFEDAANGAAHLSQAFGLNVDALEMMKAQNPAQRVEMLRKSFFQAGRSVENMTRQERALLAQQTGLEDSALDLVFSMKNQGMTYDQVTKKADAAKKTQMTQVQAMKALADSIERLVPPMSSFGSGGFIDRFIQGFTVGIQRTAEFRRIMRELRIDLRIAYFEGIKVGRAFVALFPGVKDVFNGIADIFEPKKFRAMFNNVTNAFKDFFKDMTDNPRMALPKLLERLKRDFFSWFQGNSQNGQRILDGFKKFFLALSNIAGGLLKVAMEGLKNSIKFITEVISGRKKIGIEDQASGAQGFMGQLLNPIIDAIKTAGPGLWEAVKEMFSVIWTKAKPWIRKNLFEVMSVLAGPALIGMTGRIIATSIATTFSQGLLSFVGGGGISKAFNSAKNLFSKQVSQVTEAVSKVQAVPGTNKAGSAVTGAVQGAEQAAKAASESRVNWGRALVQMTAIAVFVVVGMAGVMYALFRFAKAIQDNKLTTKSITGAALAMVATAGAMLAIAGAVKMLSAININMGMVARIGVGLGIVLVTAAVMAEAAYELVKKFGRIEMPKIKKTVAVMAATGTFFLAAAGVVAIAALIGSIALAGSGLGALTIAAGLAAIAATVEVMVQQGLRVMQAINQFRPGPGFIQKARIFIDVMRGIGEFTSSVAQMVAATQPGILDFLSGAGADEQRKTLRQVENTITVLGNQITRILDSIRNNVQQLSGSERELKSAQIIGDLLGGIANLGNALKPPSEALQEPDFMAQLNGDTVGRRISLVTEYVNEVGNKLNMFMRSVVRMLTEDIGTGFTESQVKAAQVIPAILAGVGDLAQSLRPSAALLKEMNRGAQFHGVVQHLSNFIRETMRTITSSDLFTRLGTLITTVTGSITSLDPGQARTLQAIGPVIGPLFSTVASLGSMIAVTASGRGGGDTGPAARGTQADAGAIYNMMQLVNTFFTRVRGDLPQLVAGMREVFAGISEGEATAMAKGMEGIQKFFEVISHVPQMLRSMKGMTAGQELKGDMVTLRDLQYTLDMFFLALRGTGSDNGFVPILRKITPQLVDITNSIGNPAEFSQKVTAVKAIFEVLSGVPGMIRSIGEIAGGQGRIIPPMVLDVPLQSLNNIIESLASPRTSSGLNPLVGGRLQAMLQGVTGISSDQKSMLINLVNSIVEVGNSLQSLTGNRLPNSSVGIAEAMTNINSSLDALKKQFNSEPGTFMSNVVAIRPMVAKLTAEIEGVQFDRVSRVVTGMVSELNQLSTTIRGIRPIEIEQSLQRLGDTLGLGSEGNYTIQNRNFNINLTVAIRLDNNGLDALELAMLRRIGPHTTRIKHNPLER